MADITARARAIAAWLRERMRRSHAPSAHVPAALRGPVSVSLALVALIALGASVWAMTESYADLVDFALAHGFTGWRARGAPAMVDVFIVIGELWLFICYARRLPWQAKVKGWLSMSVGLALSASGNIWHVRVADIPTRISFAVPPAAATMALYIGLQAVKMYTARMHAARSHEQPAGVPAVSPAGAAAAHVPPPRTSARRPASTRRPPVQSGPRAGGAARAQSAGKRAIKPASAPLSDDPPVQSVQAAISRGTSMREFARLHAITNWRAQALYAPGSYANPVTAVNGHAVLDQE